MTYRFFSSYLNRLGRHREAYEQAELGTIRAPLRLRPVAFYSFAIEILNHDYIRNSDNEIVSVNDESALRAGIPNPRRLC